MSVNQLLTLITQLTLVLITVLALVDLFRHRDRSRLDIVLMFGDLALIVLLQWIRSSLASPVTWLSQLESILLVAHPFLLLRLVQHLRTVPTGMFIFALAGMVVSWLLIILFPASIPVLGTLLIVVYFVVVELYSALALVRGAFTTSGVTHWRLLLAALGSGLLGALILVAGISAVFSDLAGGLANLSQLLGLFAVLSYYVGFSPPSPLRRAWQLSELHRFLRSASGQWVGEPVDQTLQRLCGAAERAVGGFFAVAARVREDENHPILVAASSLEKTYNLMNFNKALEQAWGEIQTTWERGQPVLLTAPKSPGTDSWFLGDGKRAGALLAAPIATQRRAWGLLVVFLLRVPLFASDDLALLSLFSEQTAIALGYADLLNEQKHMIEQLRRYNERLQTFNEIDRAILSARSPKDIADTTLSRLLQLIPANRANIVLFDFEKSRGVYLASVACDPLTSMEGMQFSLDGFPDLERNGKVPAYIHNLENEKEEAERLKLVYAQGVRSYITAPMINQDRLIGELLLSSTQIAGFEPEHQEIAREVADQLAISLEQARLREELQHYASELEQRVSERTAQLEEANKELEAFAYSVSHDLRAPLRAIDGFSNILITKYPAHLPEEARRYLELVRNNTKQMGQLIDDLLSFSRLSRQSLNLKSVEPADLVRVVLEELLKTQDNRQVQIVLGDLPPCQADPSLMKQVYVNLLSNALKFSSTKQSACIEIGSQIQDDAVVYYVKDNGVGFDMQYAHKLFRVFQRLHRAEEFEGTGVGLAIIQRIIQRHSGKVWVEAELNKGATFYFTLGDSAGEKVLLET